MRKTAVARWVLSLPLMMAAAACSDSDSAKAPLQVATSSTTAEEARAIDGPVMRYQERASTSANLSTLLQGVVQLDGNCLLLVQSGTQQRFPVLWPADTRWDPGAQSVVPPAGEAIRIGDSVEGRGGFLLLSDIRLLAGTAARNLAATCVENGQIAGFENRDEAIGSNGT